MSLATLPGERHNEPHYFELRFYGSKCGQGRIVSAITPLWRGAFCPSFPALQAPGVETHGFFTASRGNSRFA